MRRDETYYFFLSTLEGRLRARRYVMLPSVVGTDHNTLVLTLDSFFLAGEGLTHLILPGHHRPHLGHILSVGQYLPSAKRASTMGTQNIGTQ